jgi:nucleoside-diphosphate-sugar epimerase
MIVIFGGTGKLGFQVVEYFNKNNKDNDKIINVDIIRSNDILYDDQLIGNLINVK